MKQILLFLGGLFGLGLMGQVSFNGNGNSALSAVGGASLSLTDDGTTITERSRGGQETLTTF